MVKSMFLAALAVAQPPSLESRVAKLEAEVATIKWQQVEFGKRLDAFSLPSAKAPVAVPEYTLTPSVKSNDAPTEHFAPGTTMVCGPNGCLTPSAAPVAVSYPGGPVFQPIQQGSCANGNCSPKRGLFRRR